MGRSKGTKNVMRTPAEKECLIKEYFNSEQSKRVFAESRGIDRTVFDDWTKKYEMNGINGLKSKTGMSGSGNIYAALHTGKHLSEIDRLRLENMKKDIEIARLKKGYYVKGAGSKKEFVPIKGKNTK
ncbi:MAG: transposase [Firmicutes bacterium]|nr:transposase [Bacillota bacterium]